MSATTLYACQVSWTNGTVTITHPRAKQPCIVDTTVANQAELTISQRDLLNKIRGNGIVELTMEEMKTLVMIRDKCQPVNNGNNIVQEAINNTIERNTNRLIAKHSPIVCSKETNDEIRNLNNKEYNLTTQLRSLEKFKDGLFQLDWDISVEQEKIATPKGWKWGFRIHLLRMGMVAPLRSHRVGPRFIQDPNAITGKMLAELFNHWNECGITYDTTKIDKEETERKLQKCWESIANEIRKLHTQFIGRIDSAAKTLARKEGELKVRKEAGEDITARDYHREEGIRDNAVRQAIKRAADELEWALDCARLYDEEENLADLFEGFRAAIRSEAAAFDARMEQKSMLNSRTYKGSEVNV